MQARSSILCATWLLAAGCGGRTGLYGPAPDEGSAGAGPGACVEAEDCIGTDLCMMSRCEDGVCVEVAPRRCDDSDPCTNDACDPESGACEFVPRTSDLDGDGFTVPLPGFEPGAPGACGSDCDDSRSEAHPGGQEICDGLDNDCNGVVDDGSTYVAAEEEPLRLTSPELMQSTPGGLVFNGSFYAATYHGQSDHWRNYFHGLGADGATRIAPKQIATVASDSFAGPIVFNGLLFATAWEDRRDNDYEIYFNLLDPEGDRLGPDTRLSIGPEFSLHPALVWNGSHYVVVWDDLRTGAPQLLGRLVDSAGVPVTEEMELTDVELEAENPQLAIGRSLLGMVFKQGPADDQRIGFRTVSNDLEEVGTLVEPAVGRAVSPTITAAGGRFFLAWHTREGSSPGAAIWGAAIAEPRPGSDEVEILVRERQLTFGAAFARSKTWLPLGDRLLLIWAADYGDGYDLYAKILTLDLEETGPEIRITRNGSDSVSPVAAFGPQGDVGILFRDQRDGSWQTFFTRLHCVAGL